MAPTLFQKFCMKIALKDDGYIEDKIKYPDGSESYQKSIVVRGGITPDSVSTLFISDLWLSFSHALLS